MANYYSPSVGLSHIPNFIKAKSPMRLRRLMLLNNVKHKGFVNYFDIQFSQGFWYAWYFVEEKLSGMQRLEEGGSDASE